MKISAKAKVQNETKGALTANGLLIRCQLHHGRQDDRQMLVFLVLLETVSTSTGGRLHAKAAHN